MGYFSFFFADQNPNPLRTRIYLVYNRLFLILTWWRVRLCALFFFVHPCVLREGDAGRSAIGVDGGRRATVYGTTAVQQYFSCKLYSTIWDSMLVVQEYLWGVTLFCAVLNDTVL